MATTTRCARCGREIQAGSYLCERCREEEGPSLRIAPKPPSELERRAGRWPPWMPKPSPVQYHATIMVTIVLVLVGLALFAFLSHRGVGPFVGRADHYELRPPSTLVVQASVRNDGSKSARANCHVVAYLQNYAEASETFLTGTIDPDRTVRFQEVLRGVSVRPTSVAVRCT